jgi:hypothetical protein
MQRRSLLTILAIVCLLTSVASASAQVFTGRIDVTVKDGTGAVLPGVTVELTGAQTATAVSDERGEVHFLNLAPGQYNLTARLTGFNQYRNENLTVTAGSVIALPVTLSVGNVTEAVSVTAATPVIEAKRQAVSTSVTLDELQNVPSARDPWVVLQTVPGVFVDRVNVGGAESGQQSNYKAKGAAVGQNTWNIDGIALTDMAALGSSPTYYDFDMFQEIQATTGGADVANATPGVQLNFVLRSGTNAWRGSSRYYFENNSLQSDNVSSDLFGQIGSYNRMNQYVDTGVEAGGPILRDRLFVWGAYGRTEPRLEIYRYTGAVPQSFLVQTDDCRPTGTSTLVPENTYGISARDCTTLENYSAKATAEIDAATRASFTYFRGNKVKFGRSAGATRPAETTVDQDGPTDFFKFEVNRTFGNSLFASARYAHTVNGFTFTPQGGFDTTAYLDDDGVFHGTYASYETNRPQDNLQFESTYFRGNHELKAGFGWRRSDVSSTSAWPGGVLHLHDGYPFIQAQIARDYAVEGQGVYWNGYVSDTITHDRLTLSLGLRWDRSSSSILETSVPASPLSDLLPALTAPAVKDAVVWNSVTPRVGASYALGQDRRTLLRASYSVFASQIDSNFASTVASAIPYYSYVYMGGNDLNGNLRLDPNEYTGIVDICCFNPNDPLGGNPDRIGDYAVPRTHEVLFGVDRELMPNFGVSGSMTWRKYTGFNWLHYAGVTGEDYTQTGTLDGSAAPIGAFSIPIYEVNADAVPEDFGRVFERRDGYTQRYLGFEIAATKRMSNRWMLRGSFSGGTHREYFDGLAAQDDPTPSVPAQNQFTLLSPNRDGGLVLEQTAGSGKSSIFLASPKYQGSLAFAYQAPWDINTGLNYVMRQGYATPYFQSSVETPGDIITSSKTVLLTPDVDEFRLPTVHTFDVRVSKRLTFDRVALDLDFDVFNLFNASTELGRQYDLTAGNFNQVLEITNPRIARLGVRVAFK